MAEKERQVAGKNLVGFVVGDVAYAVPISHVREIVNPTQLTELPHPPPAVVGVADHRGEVIPIVSLRDRFSVSGDYDRSRTKWILVDVGGRSVGLMVDRVTDVFGGSALRPAPTLGSGDDLRGIAGVTNHAEVLTFVLELSNFEALTAPISAAAPVESRSP